MAESTRGILKRPAGARPAEQVMSYATAGVELGRPQLQGAIVDPGNMCTGAAIGGAGEALDLGAIVSSWPAEGVTG